MGKKGFEGLQIYQLSEELSDSVWKAVAKWPSFAKGTIGKQLVRSADSIGANIAEGTGRNSYVDNRRFVHIARGSLYETQCWLHRAYKRGLITRQEAIAFKILLDELAPRLNAYLRSIGPVTKNPDPTDSNL